MSVPLVSFFVQVYNTGSWAEECLQSILTQTGGYEFDVTVIDDASTDDTGELIAAISDSRVRVVRHAQNAGAIATANEGYAAMRGKYVIRIDSDDRLRPHFLERTVPLLDSNPRVGFVYSDIATIDLSGEITCQGKMVRRNGRVRLGDELVPLLLDNFVPAPTTLIRREALLPLLPVPSDLSFLDWYVTTGIAEGWLTYFVDEVLADYRVHPTNMHGSMIRDRTGERTILRILDALFANGVRMEEKRRWRKRIYARNFLVCADQYFGSGMGRDARRCYARAVVRQPTLALRADIVRRLFATYLPRPWYDSAKRAVRVGRNQAAGQV